MIATQPSLASILVNFGDWNADIANDADVNGGLLKIRLAVEAYGTPLGSGTAPLVGDAGNQLAAIAQLAAELVTIVGNSASLDETLALASSAALARVLDDQTLSRKLTNIQQNEV